MASVEAKLPVVIVGAGPAGLATAACLGRRGVAALVLEAGPALGAVWRRHYDRLHLHTVKHASHLPGMPFGAEVPRYPSRADVVAYLEAYAAHFGITPRTDEAVRKVRPAGEGFAVETARATYRTPAVVLAAGYNRVPNPERLPDEEAFRGPILHASAYRDGAPFAGQRVLVVGAGNTGAEIALELAERGAKPALAVRAPVNVLPRDFLGMPTQLTSIRMRWAPLPVIDGLGRLVSRLAFGRLGRYGFTRPALGPVSSIRLRRRIPLIDVGTIAAIKRGEIAVKPGVARLTAGGATFADGSEAAFDAVVRATGYRPALEELVEVPGVLDERGYPKGWKGPGIYFVGYENAPTGLLRQIGIEAEAVAREIASP